MHVAIIGNGIAGVTAARWLRKLDDTVEITIISAETDYFFSRTALMYIYMGHMRFEDTQPYEPYFWEKNRIQLVKAYVKAVLPEERLLLLAAAAPASSQTKKTTDNTLATTSDRIHYDQLIIATGSQYNKFGWPGQDLRRVGGMVSYQDLLNLEEISPEIQKAVIVGGGLIGVELAEMLHSRQVAVSLLIREESYWNNALPPEESRMVSRHIRSRGIDLQEQTEMAEILDDGQGAAAGILTKDGRRIDCQYVGLTAGVSPNINFLKGTPGLDINRGVLVNAQLETSLPGVYAIGDCAEQTQPAAGRRPVEAIWYTGRMMGETVAHNLLGKQLAYDPGIWFNAAKFFDLEYQVYGEVPPQGRAGLSSLYWEHPQGEKAIRINYDTSSGAALGFHLMGIRYRHEVCEKWIRSSAHIEEVLQNLGLANFDPEFFEAYEADVVALYNQQSGRQLQLRQKRGLEPVLRFLGLGKYKQRKT